MKDTLFDTEKKKQDALLIFDAGKQSPFWQLMVAIFDANIENLRNQLEDPESEDSLDQISRKRDKLQWYKNIRNTPELMIQQFSDELTSVEVEMDPYDQRPEAQA